MEIKTWIKYQMPYLPPRCRKTRYSDREEMVDIRLKEVDKKELVLAYEDRSFEGKGKIYRYKGKLWAKAKMPRFPEDDIERMKLKTPLDWLVYHNANYSTYFYHYNDDPKDTSREAILKRAKRDMGMKILVDGELYERTPKPEYHIMTFGLGNGDGTGLFVRYPARRDCGWHFPATEGAKAVAKAKEIAIGRRDFADAKGFKEYIICY